MPTARILTVPPIVLALVMGCAAVAVSDDELPADTTIQVGAAYADLGDFGPDWGIRARYNYANWLVAAGWNDVSDTVPSAGGPMAVKGDLWQVDVSYVWWDINEQPEEKPSLPDWYFGLGVGLANIDADWTLLPAAVTQGAKKVSFAGHVVVGAKWQRVFADLRYVFATDYWEYDSDGIQFSVGAVWPLR